MKIAIPVQGDHVATVFDAADDLLVIEKGAGPAMDLSSCRSRRTPTSIKWPS
jgi:hypothetical protein